MVSGKDFGVHTILLLCFTRKTVPVRSKRAAELTACTTMAYVPLLLSSDEKPALLVNIHGGPTVSPRYLDICVVNMPGGGVVFTSGSKADPPPQGFAAKTLVLERQYWTSRGFAVADIDYRGSAGYGREFRDKLKVSMPTDSSIYMPSS